jgi:ABC-type uncharacterized transport system permease subunit
MFWIYAAIGFFIVSGAALIIWRREFTTLQARAFGARLHPGCAVVQGVIFLLFALAYILAYRAGLFG